jgi:hypothetical protein
MKMTTIRTSIRISLCILTGLILLCLFPSCGRENSRKRCSENYDVAAYFWPAYHDEVRSRETFWHEGIGEWEIIKKGNPRFEGHYQPRIPLWGYEMDNDPEVMEKKIEAATCNGINIFIFDWYWYDGKPLLEESINEGFLKAKNVSKMKFYLMWANHDVMGYQWNHNLYKPDTILWQGEIDWNNFRLLVDRVIKQYFVQPGYFRIDNKPVFSLWSLSELVRSFSGLEGTKKALDYFRNEVEKAGFPGLHIQLSGYNHGREGQPSILEESLTEGRSVNELVSQLGINSITTYNWGGGTDYLNLGERSVLWREKWDSIRSVPYFPNVTVGYDDSPRFPEREKGIVHINNSPESFAAYLQKAREYSGSHPEQHRLITINAWNEWTEGSYLEPDMKWGYGYLESVSKVMSGIYDHCSK